MSEQKLRALLAEARECVRVNCPCCGKANCPEGSEPELSQRIDAALAEPVKDDFKRGAEAMREAAVLCGQERALYWTETSAAEGGITTMEDRAEEARSIADDIRALPVPEDEP